MPTVPRAGHERWVRSILNHDFASMPIYQFWFVAGAVVAAHYTSIRAFLVRPPWFARACFSLTFVVLMVNYYMQRVILHNPIADDVLQPIMVPYSASVALVLLDVGIRWADHRDGQGMRNMSRFVLTAAKASFDIFLFHPIMLHFVEVLVYR